MRNWAEVPPAKEDNYTSSLYRVSTKDTPAALNSQASVIHMPGRQTPTERTLEKLKNCQQNNEAVEVHIYNQAPFGYFAKYGFISCLIHNNLCGLPYMSMPPESLVDTVQPAYVSHMTPDGKVSLSLVETMKTRFWEQPTIPLKRLKKGMAFIGKVKCIKDNHIFLSHHQLNASLAIADILPHYKPLTTDAMMWRNELLSRVFEPDILVEGVIQLMGQHIIPLKWNKLALRNAAIVRGLGKISFADSMCLYSFPKLGK